MAIQGKSYYKTEGDVTNQTTIGYGFDVLNAEDITVFAFTGDSVRITLTEGNASDYIVNTTTNEVICNYPTWYDVPSLVGETISYLRIFRTTTTAPLVDFQNGAVLNQNDLDTAYRQGLFAAQEVAEDASDTSPNGVQSVGTSQIEDLAVTSGKLAASAVIASKIQNEAVETDKIKDDAVDNDKLADNSVDTPQLVNEAVETDQIKDNAVETEKLADDAVTYDKVAPPSKANMEGQSAAGVVTPDVLKHSPFSPKCYGTVTYGSSDAVGFSNSFNVESATEPAGTDVRRITFTNALADANYVVLVTVNNPQDDIFYTAYVKAQQSTYFDIKAFSDETDDVLLNFVVFGSTYD